MRLPTKTAFLENIMLRFLKVLPLTFALAALSLFTACGSSSSEVRFVNAIQDTQDYGNEGLDIQVNNTTRFTDVPFFGFQPSSGYTSVPSGNSTFNGFETGSTSSPVFSHTVSLSSGNDYTVVATGFDTGTDGSNVVIMAPTDNNTAPANGSVNFRVINASPSGPGGGGAAADVYILPNPNDGLPGSCAAPTCFADVQYNTTTPYVTVPYNSEGNGWQLIVTVTGSQGIFINTTIPNFGSAAEGAICTLVLTDQQNGFEMNSTPVFLNDLNGCAN
jgi:hypothetical protein